MKIHDLNQATPEEWAHVNRAWHGDAVGFAFGPMPPDHLDAMIADIDTIIDPTIAAKLPGHFEGFRYDDEHGSSLRVMLVK